MTHAVLSQTGMLEAHCAATGQYGMLLVFPPWTTGYDWVVEIKKACPFAISDTAADIGEGDQAVSDGYGFVFAASREEIDTLFDQVVGDEGPTKSNPYDGPARVYALTCGPNGCLNENT